MRRSILVAALALGAQAAWAQDTTEVMTPETEVVDIVSETSEGDGEADLAGEGAGDTGTEVPESDGDETGVVAEEEAAEVEVVEDETEVEVVEEDAKAPEIEVRTNSRSPTGAFRGGHHGRVSTLATAGLGPVFGKLRSQGYGDIRIERMGDQIFISAARGAEVRELVYDATTGTLVSDVSAGAPTGLVETIAAKLKHKPARGMAAAEAATVRADGRADRGHGKSGSNAGGNGRGNGRGGNNGGGGDYSDGGGSKGGSSGAGSNGGGNGKGNGSGQGNGNGNGRNR